MVKRPKSYQMPVLPVATFSAPINCDICDVYALCRVMNLSRGPVSLCVLCLATLLEQITGQRISNLILSNARLSEIGAMNQRSKDKKAWEEANAASTD